MTGYLIERPSPLSAVCAPTSASWLPIHGSIVDAAFERAQLSQVAQASTQAQTARVRAAASGSSKANGLFGSKGASPVVKHMTDGTNGVPPRGRPV